MPFLGPAFVDCGAKEIVDCYRWVLGRKGGVQEMFQQHKPYEELETLFNLVTYKQAKKKNNKSFPYIQI